MTVDVYDAQGNPFSYTAPSKPSAQSPNWYDMYPQQQPQYQQPSYSQNRSVPSAPNVLSSSATSTQVGAPSSLIGGQSQPGQYKDFMDYAWQTAGVVPHQYRVPGGPDPNAASASDNAATWAQKYQQYLATQQKPAAQQQGGAPGGAMPLTGTMSPQQMTQMQSGGGMPMGGTGAPMGASYGGTPSGGYAPQQSGNIAGSIYGGVGAPGGGETPGIRDSSGMVVNPYSALAQSSGNYAGQMAGNQAGANFGQADMLRSGAGAIMNTAFDPQNALYNRTAQQLQDQVRVGEAARGITSSPYGAGVENQAMSNFNIDWQNQQLQRQAQGLEGAKGASTAGFNIGAGGIGQTQQVGQMPYDVWQGQQQNDINNWNQYLNQQNATTGMQIQNYPNVASTYREQNPYIPTGIFG